MPFPASFPLVSLVRRHARAAAVTLAATLVLAGCGDPDDDPVPASEQSDPGSSETSEPTSAPTTDTTEEPTPAGTAVPIYFVGDGPGGEPRLFREFHRVEGDPLTEAARLVAGGGEALDPDYRTLWPQVEISSVSATDGVLLVQIPSDAFTERPDGMTERDARLAMQQLVYTLQGVQQERVPVLIKRGGTDFRLFGLPTDVEVNAESALRTLNLVNITSPAEGDTVTGDTLEITGVSNSFEASGPCWIFRGEEELVGGGYQAEAWMGDRLFPFEGRLPLDGISGEVTLRCETDDPSGGAEGPGPAVDTKTITVQ